MQTQAYVDQQETRMDAKSAQASLSASRVNEMARAVFQVQVDFGPTSSSRKRSFRSNRTPRGVTPRRGRVTPMNVDSASPMSVDASLTPMSVDTSLTPMSIEYGSNSNTPIEESAQEQRDIQRKRRGEGEVDPSSIALSRDCQRLTRSAKRPAAKVQAEDISLQSIESEEAGLGSPLRVVLRLAPASNPWSPESKKEVETAVLQITPNRYQRTVAVATQEAEKLNMPVPDQNYLQQLEKFGAKWDEVVDMFIHMKPHALIRTREQAKLQKADILKQGPVAHHQCLSQVRVKDLELQASLPPMGAWSPGTGTLSSFASFIRRRYEVTSGRNVAIAIARDHEKKLIYTVAVTDGPAGGDHSELMAWDAMPDYVKKAKQGIIYTEREPCTKGSRCLAKIKQMIGDGCFIVYTTPIVGGTRHCVYASSENVTNIARTARSLLLDQGFTPTSASDRPRFRENANDSSFLLGESIKTQERLQPAGSVCTWHETDELEVDKAEAGDENVVVA